MQAACEPGKAPALFVARAGDRPMIHTPVMVDEVLTYLLHAHSRFVVDATIGCGGHTMAILNASQNIKVLGIDRDPEALNEAGKLLARFSDRVRLEHANYIKLGRLLSEQERPDGVLVDLGLSSLQLDRAARGFSYLKDGPLDMQMGGAERTAAALLRKVDTAELATILKQFGDVRRASRIARAIRRAADQGKMTTTHDLKKSIDSLSGRESGPNLLSKVFQAIRIAVNDELTNIRKFLGRIVEQLNDNARIVVISYHSAEDRIVKDFLKQESTGCVCPPKVPVCSCEHKATLEVLTRRVVKPSKVEVERNSRARSARLRAARVLSRG